MEQITFKGKVNKIDQQDKYYKIWLVNSAEGIDINVSGFGICPVKSGEFVNCIYKINQKNGINYKNVIGFEPKLPPELKPASGYRPIGLSVSDEAKEKNKANNMLVSYAKDYFIFLVSQKQFNTEEARKISNEIVWESYQFFKEKIE